MVRFWESQETSPSSECGKHLRLIAREMAISGSPISQFLPPRDTSAISMLFWTQMEVSTPGKEVSIELPISRFWMNNNAMVNTSMIQNKKSKVWGLMTSGKSSPCTFPFIPQIAIQEHKLFLTVTQRSLTLNTWRMSNNQRIGCQSNMAKRWRHGFAAFNSQTLKVIIAGNSNLTQNWTCRDLNTATPRRMPQRDKTLLREIQRDLSKSKTLLNIEDNWEHKDHSCSRTPIEFLSLTEKFTKLTQTSLDHSSTFQLAKPVSPSVPIRFTRQISSSCNRVESMQF